MSANDTQVGGTHYAGEYQHWDYVQDSLEGRYLEGQVTKYVCRYRRKNGAEDLRKALHYLDKMFESRVFPMPPRRFRELSRESQDFALSFGGMQSFVLSSMPCWSSHADLLRMRREIERVLEDGESHE